MKKYVLVMLLGSAGLSAVGAASAAGTKNTNRAVTTTPAPVAETKTANREIMTADVGLTLPIAGGLKDIADPGLSFGAEGMHPIDAFDSLGGNVSYFTFGKDSMDGIDTEVSILSMLALYRHNIQPQTNRTPFFEGGFGFARTQVNISVPNAEGPAITRGTNEEDISPTLMFGLGVDMPVSNGASLGISARYQHFFFKVGDINGGGALNILVNLRV